MGVISFHRAVEARAEQAQSRLNANAVTIEVTPGVKVAQQSQRVTATDRLAVERVSRGTQYFADAEATGAPVKAVSEAWANFRTALSSLPMSHLKVTWGGEPNDCRSVALSDRGVDVGTFSLVDGTQPRSAIALRAEIRGLVYAHRRDEFRARRGG